MNDSRFQCSCLPELVSRPDVLKIVVEVNARHCHFPTTAVGD